MKKANVVANDRTPCSQRGCTNYATGLGSRNEPLCSRCRQLSKEASEDRSPPLQDLGADPHLAGRHGG